MCQPTSFLTTEPTTNNPAGFYGVQRAATATPVAAHDKSAARAGDLAAKASSLPLVVARD